MSSSLDRMLSGVLGKLGKSGTNLGPAITGMFTDGGLAKVVSQFKSAGLDKQADSWIGTGTNEPITSDHVKQALTDEQITEVADRVAVSKDEAADALAQALPEAVDKLTPAGRIPDPAEIDEKLLVPAGR